MNQIDEIKELQRQGLGPQDIASRLRLKLLPDLGQKTVGPIEMLQGDLREPGTFG
jgi:hypothetical protein